MSSKEWKCLEIHIKSYEQLNSLNADIFKLTRKLKEESHLESYFFNRYSDSSKKEYFIKLGLVNSDKKAQSELNNLSQKYGGLIKPYPCETWKVDGVRIDKIKCISCELFEKVSDSFPEKFTIKQASYLLHFLMNQSGYSYEDEYELYKALMEHMKSKLEKST